MNFETQLADEISNALRSSYNRQMTLTNQYHLAINIAKHYAQCELPAELDALADMVDSNCIEPKDLEAINSEKYTLAMARWAIHEAKIKNFLRIVNKFRVKQGSPLAAEISNHLDILFNPALDDRGIDYTNALFRLKSLLIKTRLEHRYAEKYTSQKIILDQVIEDYVSGKKDLDETKHILSRYQFPNDQKIHTTLTKFCAFRTIETPEQMYAKVFDEAKGIFHEIFAKEADIFGGLERTRFQGDEVLYRGIDQTNGRISADDIRSWLNSVHRSQSMHNTGIAQQDFITDEDETEPASWNGRQSQSTAFALNPLVAVYYALALNNPRYIQSRQGWIFEYRPKQSQFSLNLMKYNHWRAPYTEMDLEQVFPEDIIAIHQVSITSVKAANDEAFRYQITDSIPNPHYKKRGDEKTVFSFFERNLEAIFSTVQLKEFKRDATVLLECYTKPVTSDEYMQIDTLNESAARVYERYQRNEDDPTGSREKVTKSNIKNRRKLIKTYASLLEEWKSAEMRDTVEERTYEGWLEEIKTTVVPFKKQLGKTGVSCSDWFIYFKQSSEMTPSTWKCFLSVDAEDYEKAANILINRYFNTPKTMQLIESAKIAIKKPIGENGRLAIILYASDLENAEGWSQLLSQIEKDFWDAGIKPRPLSSQKEADYSSIANDNKIPGSLYTYYKNDHFLWRLDRTAGYFEGVSVKNIAEAIKEKRLSIASKEGISKEEDAAFDDVLKITELAGKEGAEAIQENRNNARACFIQAHTVIEKIKEIEHLRRLKKPTDQAKKVDILDCLDPMYQQKLQAKLTEGSYLETMERYNDALQIYADLDQHNPQVLFSIGLCLRKMGLHDDALKIYRRMQQDEPQVMLALGQCHQEREHYTEALEIYNSMKPDLLEVILAKGQCLRQMGRHFEALKIYNGMRSEVMLAKGQCFREIGYHDEALNLYKRMKQDLPEVMLAIKNCLEEVKRFSKDKNRDVIGWCCVNRMYQQTLLAKLTEGSYLETMERYNDALQIYADLDQYNPQVMFSIGLCLRKMGLHDDALKIYRRMQQDEPQVLLALGQCYQEMEHYGEALEIYNSMTPNLPEVILAKGQCLRQMGRTQEALKVYSCLGL